MILLMSYADAVADAARGQAIIRLTEAVDRFAPPMVGLHLLPFSPSAGDWGFAPNDLLTVRAELGRWADIKALAERRRVVVDGVYNHVGIGHVFAQQFFASPGEYSQLFHAFTNADPSAAPRSPRGGSVLRTYSLADEQWQLWQTFSDVALDIQLDRSEIRNELRKHLARLVANGIWGVRLDAPAYYAKKLGERQRHHPDAYRLAREVAAMIRSHGLAAMAQLDCDEYGVRYYPPDLGFDVPIVDYAYSAHLAFAMLSGNPMALAGHIRRTWKLPTDPVRAPRTHDGILLRSANLSTDVKMSLVELAARFGISTRVIDDDPYELNSSLPHLYACGVGAVLLRKRIELAVAVTALVPGWSYLYLPYLVGDIPEERTTLGADEDPRSLNRQPIPKATLDTFLDSDAGKSMNELLSLLATVHGKRSEARLRADDAVTTPNATTLSIRRGSPGFHLIANFSINATADVTAIGPRANFVVGRDCSRSRIGPLGFGLWRY